MERSIQDQARTIQTDSHVLWNVQLSHNIPKDDGQNIQGRNSQSMGHNLHG